MRVLRAIAPGVWGLMMTGGRRTTWRANEPKRWFEC